MSRKSLVIGIVAGEFIAISQRRIAGCVRSTVRRLAGNVERGQRMAAMWPVHWFAGFRFVMAVLAPCMEVTQVTDELSCCYFEDGEPIEAVVDKIQKARKVHKCSECLGPINPGDLYEYVFGKI